MLPPVLAPLFLLEWSPPSPGSKSYVFKAWLLQLAFPGSPARNNPSLPGTSCPFPVAFYHIECQNSVHPSSPSLGHQLTGGPFHQGSLHCRHQKLPLPSLPHDGRSYMLNWWRKTTEGSWGPDDFFEPLYSLWTDSLSCEKNEQLII